VSGDGCCSARRGVSKTSAENLCEGDDALQHRADGNIFSRENPDNLNDSFFDPPRIVHIVPHDAASWKRKVLWVATDEVAFGFMDTLAPGSVAMYPSEKSVSPSFFAFSSASRCCLPCRLDVVR